ncbi:MAG: hypothetical protein ACRD3B_11640 [Candidatus Sulfotelmatobacter sp.]
MMFRSCSYEKEVTQALKAGHWPEGCAPELRSHVEACASCSDFVLVTQTFQRARSESVQAPPTSSPGLLWWKAQLRRRNAVVESVSRPITVAQTFAWIVTLIVGVVLVTSQYNHGLRWADWFSKPTIARASLMFSSMPDGSEWNSLLLIFGVGTVVLLGGLVVYLVSERS